MSVHLHASAAQLVCDTDEEYQIQLAAVEADTSRYSNVSADAVARTITFDINETS